MLGLGPKNTPIKEAPGWKRLTTEEKFQLDLDWRQKLSGENLDAAETKEFISLWASANKYGARHPRCCMSCLTFGSLVGDLDAMEILYASQGSAKTMSATTLTLETWAKTAPRCTSAPLAPVPSAHSLTGDTSRLVPLTSIYSVSVAMQSSFRNVGPPAMLSALAHGIKMTHRRFPLCGCSNPNEHGTVWVSYCKTVEIIDIPGNHFTLLSQVRASPQPDDCLTCLLSPS